MNFQISSKKIGNPLLIELLKKLVDCFDTIGLPFYVIGATARDIIIRQLIDIASQRRTQDLDIAIAIPDWDKFEAVSKILIAAGLEKSVHQHQRFHMGGYVLDIVPYDGVAKEDDNIYWPPEENIAMSVKGFDEVLQDAITVNIDGDFDIKIASLHGLFLLKFNAWLDRNQKTSKDAEDMCFIIENYFDANIERKFPSKKYTKVYDREDFDTYMVGGVWLAYDLLPLLNPDQLAFYANRIQEEIDKEENSRLINQILEHRSSLSYNLVIKTWQEIANIFDAGR
ncbi:MAG: nucleotidyl transferase AbiEii/AbiGii toxin family protein [Prevotella sp.]|jgi:predicted nucleotidyltransferase|nr:nucleotidyl transferase AbiEii/AbiGii toxin family protein [Prevotella sp.]